MHPHSLQRIQDSKAGPFLKGKNSCRNADFFAERRSQLIRTFLGFAIALPVNPDTGLTKLHIVNLVYGSALFGKERILTKKIF